MPHKDPAAHAAYVREWRARNIKKARAQERARYKRETKKAYRYANREQVRAQGRDWYAKHKDEREPWRPLTKVLREIRSLTREIK